MRILIDILHPAHVHFFRNFYDEMADRGHELCITARDKDRSVDLLEQFGLPVPADLGAEERDVGHGQSSWPQRTRRLLKVMRRVPARRDDRDHGPVDRAGRRARRACRRSCSTTPSSRRQTNWFVYPLAHSVVHARLLPGQGARHARHATRATTSSPTSTRTGSSPIPASSPRSASSPDEPYSIVRFVSWQAVHDRSETGLTGQQKRRPGRACSQRHGRVLISSEAPLPADLAELEVHGPGRGHPPSPRARADDRRRVGDDVVGGGRARRARR